MTIEQIKSSLSIGSVLSHYNLKTNRNQMLCCPFHADGKASMKIYKDTNTVYCFAGSCQVQSLDVIDFILEMDKCTKHEAIKKAKTLAGNPIKQNKSKMNTQNPDVQLMSELFTYFQKSLKHSQSKTAKRYKESRGLNGVLKVGYNSGKFHNGKSEEVLNRCLSVGLLKPSEHGYQIWGNSCLVFALRNPLGEVVSFYGRSVKSDGHYYLQNRRGLYPYYPAVDTKCLVLTESVIDAASLLQLELPLENYAVLSLYGTNGLTTEHRQAILQCIELEEIIFCLDGDEAGRKATDNYTEQLKELYPKLRFTTLDLVEGEDINSLYVGHEQTVNELFVQLFDNRKEVGKVEVVEESKSSKSSLITDNPELLIFGNEVLQVIVLGGIRLEGLDRLRVTLKLEHGGKTLRHNLDLYNDDQVEGL